jgi:hypothetical protein
MYTNGILFVALESNLGYTLFRSDKETKIYYMDKNRHICNLKRFDENGLTLWYIRKQFSKSFQMIENGPESAVITMRPIGTFRSVLNDYTNSKYEFSYQGIHYVWKSKILISKNKIIAKINYNSQGEILFTISPQALIILDIIFATGLSLCL